MTNPMPPGWYDDPDGSPNAERRWDGFNWTPERRRKARQTPTPHQPPRPVQASPYPQPAASPPYVQPAQAPPPYQSVPPSPYPPLGPVQTSSYPQPSPPQYPQPSYPPLGPTQPGQEVTSNLFSIIAFVCAGLALLGGVAVMAPLPTVFGVAAIICAVIALTKKERLAPFAIGAAVGGLLLGWILQAVLWNTFLFY
jgi:hypothetical protein